MLESKEIDGRALGQDFGLEDAVPAGKSVLNMCFVIWDDK